jgi:8-oxo-dGTP pyrophosphatase MutT (NUDIX family)
VVLEQSIGAVVKYQSRNEDEFADYSESGEFLLLRNRRGSWGFPQGHKEKGETEIETLKREVIEETGINNIDIQSYIGKIRYSYFKADGMKSEKEVTFYFATASSRNVRISKEHEGFKWVKYSDALLALNHRQLKSILIRGHRKGLY